MTKQRLDGLQMNVAGLQQRRCECGAEPQPRSWRRFGDCPTTMRPLCWSQRLPAPLKRPSRPKARPANKSPWDAFSGVIVKATVLTFNAILRHEGIDPKRVRLVRHQDNRSSVNTTPYNLWRVGDGRLELYQRISVIEI